MSGMSADAGNTRRVSGGRLAFISFFSPPVGVIAYMLAAIAVERPSDDPVEIMEVLAVVFLMGWPIGIIPASLAALVWRFVPKPPRVMGRLALALLVGAVSGPVGMGIVMWLLDLAAMTLALGAIFSLAGAVALAATAIPFSKG